MMTARMMEEKKKKYVPEFLRARFEILGTVTFAALFSVVVLLVSIPFTNNAWFRLGNSVFFGFTILFVSLSLLLLILSRYIMYRTRNSFQMTWGEYVGWCLGELFLISILYTVFTVTIARPEDKTAVGIFINSFEYVLVCLGFPYIIAAMFFTIVHQEKTIRLINMKEDLPDDVEAQKGNRLEKITLFDNSGVLKLSVSSSQLYYIESDDNYIKVWYLDGKGNLKTYMLRCRLKTVEESFAGTDLVRCHRKFIVNMAKVKVLRKEKDGYELELDDDRIEPIPVTKTYTESVLSVFSEGKTA